MPGGICAFTVWKRLPWLDILADAINQEYKNRPMKFPSHEDALMSLTRWNPWHDIEWIRRKVKEVGFIEEEDGRSSLSSSPSSFVKHEADEITQKEDESENGTQKTDEDIEEKKDDWSMYEFESAQGRSVSVPSPRRTSRNDKSTSPRTASPSSGSFMPDSTSTSPACESSATLPLSPPPVPSNSRVSAHDKGSLTIESTISTHRYTKHEFISNFGTSVLDHLLAASWGKERIFTKNDSVRIELREALNRYLCRKYPEDWDEIEVEMEALVVIIKKGEKVDVPSEM